MLLAYRIPQNDAQRFGQWAQQQGMEAITEMPAENGTVVSLFRSDRAFLEEEIAKSGLPVRSLKLPRFNIEVDDLEVLGDIMAGGNPFSIGAESIREFIRDILSEARPVTVHSKRENQNYVIYPDSPNNDHWKYALI